MNIKLIKSLEREQEELLVKLEKVRENGDYNSYKNLIRALTEVTQLIQRESEGYDRFLYFEVDKDCVSIYFNGGVYQYANCDFKMVSEEIKRLIRGLHVKVYGNTRGLGVGLSDRLRSVGIIVEDTQVYNFNPTRGQFGFERLEITKGNKRS